MAYSPPTPKPKAPSGTPQPAKPAAGPPKPAPAPIPRPGQTSRPGGNSAQPKPVQPKPGQPKPASPKPGASKPVGGGGPVAKPQGGRTPSGLKLPTAALPKTAGTTQAKPGQVKPKSAKPTIQPAVPRLTDSQVKSTQDWYASRAKQYTPQVLKEIQQKLGLPKTGKADVATVQAIAKWQAGNKPLPIAGKPGKFSANGQADAVLLEHIFPEGLSKPESVKGYTADFNKLMVNWPNMSVEARKKSMENLINKTLSDAGVPAIELADRKMDSSMYGSYSFADREMSINENLYSRDKMTYTDQIKLADTIYHESRHAEQGFNMVRFDINNNKMRSGLTSRSVINLAEKKLIKPDSILGIKTRAIYESVVGEGSEHRIDVLVALKDPILKNKMENLQQSRENLYDQFIDMSEKRLNLPSGKKDPALEEKILKIRSKLDNIDKSIDTLSKKMDEIYKNYIALPEESDAWRIGGEAGRIYGKK